MANELNILLVTSSGRGGDSASRNLALHIADDLRARADHVRVVERDLVAQPPRVVNQDWVGANFTPADDRSPAQRLALEESDILLQEFANADAIIVAVPIYNFTIPASLKLWIDQVARVGRTFNYTEQGPIPILPARPTTLVVSSGGTGIDSEIDFATPYMRHVLGFLGLTDVSVVKLDRLMFGGEGKIATARADADLRAQQVADAIGLPTRTAA